MADFGTYSLADVAAQVKAADAKAFKRDAAPLARDDEITRYWKVDNHLRERVRPFLDLYGDGDHCIPPTPPATVPAECHAILNPMMDDGVSAPGLYRVVRNWEDAQLPGMVIQTLRRGWITALVSGSPASEGVPSTEAVDWSEARITDGDTGSLLPAPVGAGSNLSCRRRVVKIVWTCVDPTKRFAVVESMMALASNHAAWANATVRGEALGTGWVRLGATSRLADDGSAVVELILAQAEAVFELYRNRGTANETRESIVHGVPVDQVQGYVDGFRRYGALSAAGAIPLGGGVQGSIDPASGLATLDFFWKSPTAAPGAQVVGLFVNQDNWQLHFIAWNQPSSNILYLTANPVAFGSAAKAALGGGENWQTGVVMNWPAGSEWTLAAFNYDEETGLYSWHVTWRPIPDAAYDGLVQYTSQWKTRMTWMEADGDQPEPFVQQLQVNGTLFRHEHKLFGSLASAWMWRAASQLLEVPYPRQIGDKWLAIKTTVQSCTGWQDATNEEEQPENWDTNGWLAPTDINLKRFGIVIPDPSS